MTAPQQWPADARNRAMELAEEVGPVKAAEQTGIPVKTITSWRARRRAKAERERQAAEQQAAVDAALGAPVDPDDDLGGYLEQTVSAWFTLSTSARRKAQELVVAGRGREAKELTLTAAIAADKGKALAADRDAIVAEVAAVRAKALATVLVDVLHRFEIDVDDDTVAEVVHERLMALLAPAAGLADDIVREARARARRLAFDDPQRESLLARAGELDARAAKRAEQESRLAQFLEREIEELVGQVAEERVAQRPSPPGEGSPDDEPDEDEGLVDEEGAEPEPDPVPVVEPAPLRAVEPEPEGYRGPDKSWMRGSGGDPSGAPGGSRSRRLGRSGSVVAFASQADLEAGAEAAGVKPGAPVGRGEVDGLAMDDADRERLRRFMGGG